MLGLARSFARFAWTSTLAGAEQVVSPTRPLPALEAMTWASWNELEELLQLAVLAGRDFQDEGLEILGDVFTPWRWGRAAAWFSRRSADAARFVVPAGNGTLARLEWRNKFDVFWKVKGVRRDLAHPPAPQRFDLAEYVERAYDLGTYPALWAIEGLGHDYASTFLSDLEAGENPGILTDPELRDLPESSMPMLHGGLGLALSEHILKGLTPQSPAGDFRDALRRFVDWSEQNARPEYLDSVLESFGLEVRCFFAHLVSGFEEVLDGADPRMPAYFWHGLGRALYFIPVNFIPGWGSAWHAVEMSRRESPHELARRNSLAGLAYAFTMVNMSEPRILESLLAAHGEELESTAWADGLAAAVKVRDEITPGAAVLRRFLDHEPEQRTARLWKEIVTEPCRRALSGELGELYQALERRGPTRQDEEEAR